MACYGGYERILVRADTDYHSVTENISADKTYTIPFLGRNMIFYASKAVVLQMNDAANDTIPLAAHIGIKIDGFNITKVILTSVIVNTDVQFIVTG